jgi:hypothetical protein
MTSTPSSAAGPCSAVATPMRWGFDAVRSGALPPFADQLLFAQLLLALPRLVSHQLRRCCAFESGLHHAALDALAAERESHHLFAAIALQLPRAVGRIYSDPVTEPLHRVRQFGAINGSRVNLRAVDLLRIERTPLAVGPARQIEKDDMGMELWVGRLILWSALGWPRSDMVEACRNHIAGDDRFLAGALT